MKELTRRSFLKLSGAAVLAVGMAGALSGCDSDSSTKEDIVSFGEVATVDGKKVKFMSAHHDTLNNEKVIVCVFLISSNEELTLSKDNFTARMNGKTSLEVLGVSNSSIDTTGGTASVPKADEGAVTTTCITLKDDEEAEKNFTKLEVTFTVNKKSVTASTNKFETSGGALFYRLDTIVKNSQKSARNFYKPA